MTRGSIREYAEAVRERYRRVPKKGKGEILDEFTQVTGYHRKAAIRLLRSLTGGGNDSGARRGRPKRYDSRIAGALKTVWEATDRLCSRRLHPFLPEIIPVLRRYGETRLSAEVEQALCQMSPSTIDRRLRPYRRTGGRRALSATRPGSLLKQSIPIRTFADWEDHRPGFLEVDLVAHCGESTDGFYLTTLAAVDVATRWVECQGVWGKGQQRVQAAIHRVRQRLPFPLLGIDSDNGSEFINHHLAAYCTEEDITFTRSRPYKKNDSAYVEQKNWSIVRRLLGYDRYTSRAALECLNRLYDLVRLYANFFQPVMKLQAKTRHGAKVHKVYDTAATPYQRLLACGVLDESKHQELAAIYRGLNPVYLLELINKTLEQLWAKADLPVRLKHDRVA